MLKVPSGIYVRTNEGRRNISESIKGVKNPNYGKFGKEHHLYGKHRSEETKKKISESHKGKKQKPFTEETKKKMRESHKGLHHSDETKKKIGDGNRGKIVSEEAKKKMSESWKGHKHSEETKKKMSKSQQKRKERDGYMNSPKARKKIGEANKGKFIGEKSHFWNPNREEVYAPYGENFYNQNIRNNKKNLQNGRDMLTGTILDPNKRSSYHHIDYIKSNDDPDNHCFLSINNHARITNYQQNPIKSEKYKKILQENTQALKNGQIPKNWSPLSRELFRQEKLKQLDLSSYII